jgi:glutathione S-transferase
MKLYHTALSTSCRPVIAFLSDAGIAYDSVPVDFGKGEHKTPAMRALNPNGALPILDDEGFVLTESSAILKYVAEKNGSAMYPKELRPRARVNERMDWFNTHLASHCAHDLVYPQLLPHHKRGSDEATEATVRWGLENTTQHLAVLEQWLGQSKFVAGDTLTIADFFGASFASLPRTIGGNLKSFPKVSAWLDAIESRPSWAPATAAFTGLQQHLASQGAQLVTVR